MDRSGPTPDAAPPYRNFDTFGRGRLIKTTLSLCPVCLEPVGAEVYERAGQVWMDKRCAAHGPCSALLSSDARHYYEPAPRSAAPGPAPASCCSGARGCGDPLSQHSCTVLIEITERCNLTCPTCYAGSSPQHTQMMGLDEFTRHVDRLVVDGKRNADMIQLSGGEPTVHPELPAMIDVLASRGFRNICINTNGIKMASPEFTRRLVHHDAELFVYLQFDGFEAATYQALRGRPDLLDCKRRAIENCLREGIGVHPVMTVARGINDHEVGAFINLAVDYPQIKNVIIQPAMYSGRYDNPKHVARLTLADTVELIVEQFGVFSAHDFGPIPCSHPNCFGMAVALRSAAGLVPISRLIPRYAKWGDHEIAGLIDRVSDTINGPQAFSEFMNWAFAGGHAKQLLAGLDDSEVDRLLEALIAWQRQSSGDRDAVWDALLVVGIKPFMDAENYDQDRIDQCCVHILDPKGRPVSFCEYNAVHRPRLAAANHSAAANRSAAAVASLQIVDS